MHIHILGICGTFMAGVAAIARSAGHRVTGSDQGVYPPMSDQLADLGIDIVEGYGVDQLGLNPDVVIIGNVMMRGMPIIEAVLNRKLAYTSGPEWLAREVLAGRRVAAVAGTHGKTTTASLLAWILEFAGQQPGFLIGGVPRNFSQSARLGEGDVFVIEADEYDTAFFDKRAKFLHYHPDTQIIGNIEFDHADIYANLEAIQWQFHQLLRTLPGNGHLIVPAGSRNVDALLAMGCWTPVETFSSAADEAADWRAAAGGDGSLVVTERESQAERQCQWSMPGAHNAENALAALLAARHLGVDPDRSLQALAAFKGVKRRLELRGNIGGVEVYDDFAHHPTAIRKTIEGLRSAEAGGRLLVALEPRSNTMRLGHHRDTLAAALTGADAVWVYEPPDLQWDLKAAMSGGGVTVSSDVENIVDGLTQTANPQDRIIIMSNGGFDGIHARVERALEKKFAPTESTAV